MHFPHKLEPTRHCKVFLLREACPPLLRAAKLFLPLELPPTQTQKLEELNHSLHHPKFSPPPMCKIQNSHLVHAEDRLTAGGASAHHRVGTPLASGVHLEDCEIADVNRHYECSAIVGKPRLPLSTCFA